MGKKDPSPKFFGLIGNLARVFAQRLNITVGILSAVFVVMAVHTFIWVQNGGKIPPLQKAPTPGQEQEETSETETTAGGQPTATSTPGPTSTPTPGPTSTPTPTPANIWEPWVPTPRPLAHGIQTYTVSGSKSGAPKATEITIDSLDPGVGGSQSVSANVIDMGAGPVTNVSVELITDNETTTHSLELTSGTNSDGTWEGTWTMEDSYDSTYQMEITAENASTDWTVTLSFR